ncbi:hypothetical protein DFH09DRAFT_1088861 [Mycena vulgaris]|nr:hypothetical protein DFH09DRAFT_1088861 [Mycena vulgaris]
MHNFNFRAYLPRPEPATAPPRNSEYNARGSGPNAATSSVFRSYIPPGSAQEPAIFSHVVPPAQSSSSTFKTFNPPPVVSPNVKRGSYEYDLASGDYSLSWASFSDLKAWLRAEEVEKTIDRIKNTPPRRRHSRPLPVLTEKRNWHFWMPLRGIMPCTPRTCLSGLRITERIMKHMYLGQGTLIAVRVRVLN